MSNREPHRTFRASDELWEAAKEKAGQQDTSVSAILRERLEELVQS